MGKLKKKVLLSGCSIAIYGRIGNQELDNVTLSLEKQRSDPNIPVGLIDVLVKLLK
jgi:hypothetical protein